MGNIPDRIHSAMIRESRKVGFRLFVGSHSELVKPLGLEGQGDVRDGLLFVRLYYSQIRKERRATVDAGEGEEPCQFPAYYAPPQLNAGAMEFPEFKLPDLVIQKKLTPKQREIQERRDRVAELIRAGVSDEEIAAFQADAMSGDYDHVIQTAMAWVDVT